MKKWGPLILSIVAHGLLIGWLAISSLPIPTVQPKTPTISAKLIRLPVPAPVTQTTQPQITEPAVPSDAPEPSTLAPPEPTPEVQQDAPLAVDNSDNKELTSSTVESTTAQPALTRQSIVNATRQALTQLQSINQDVDGKSQKQWFDRRDARLIENGPQVGIPEQDFFETPPPVEVDCAKTASKVMLFVSRTLGGRIDCKDYSSAEINHFINQHKNKLPQATKRDSEFDQPD